MKSLIFLFFYSSYSILSFVFLVGTILVFRSRDAPTLKFLMHGLKKYVRIKFIQSRLWIFYLSFKTNGLMVLYGFYILTLNIFYFFFNFLFFLLWFTVNNNTIDLDYLFFNSIEMFNFFDNFSATIISALVFMDYQNFQEVMFHF